MKAILTIGHNYKEYIMENLIKSLETVKTFKEALEMIEEYIKPLSWYKFLKWEQFNMYDLMMCYDLMEDDDTTVWKEDTPNEEKEKGTEILVAIRKKIIITT